MIYIQVIFVGILNSNRIKPKFRQIATHLESLTFFFGIMYIILIFNLKYEYRYVCGKILEFLTISELVLLYSQITCLFSIPSMNKSEINIKKSELTKLVKDEIK